MPFATFGLGGGRGNGPLGGGLGGPSIPPAEDALVLTSSVGDAEVDVPLRRADAAPE